MREEAAVAVAAGMRFAASSGDTDLLESLCSAAGLILNNGHWELVAVQGFRDRHFKHMRAGNEEPAVASKYQVLCTF